MLAAVVRSGGRLKACAHVQAGKPFSAQSGGKMGYVDFVWFILSEEDKGNDVSLEYWFKCVDLDDDGFLRSNEMLVGMHCAKYSAPCPAGHSTGRQCQGSCEASPRFLQKTDIRGHADGGRIRAS